MDNDTIKTIIKVEYNPIKLSGLLLLEGSSDSSIWVRLKDRAIDDPDGRISNDNQIELPWISILGLLKDFGGRKQQSALGFRFQLIGEAEQLAKKFIEEFHAARAARSTLSLRVNEEEISSRLKSFGFVRRELKAFQIRDLIHLLSIPHGANFSVPGAGKTTVAFALHLLVDRPDQHFFVIGPKSSFSAWLNVIDECIEPAVEGARTENFTILDGSVASNELLLQSSAKMFLMSYDLMVRQQSMLSAYFSRKAVHVVLDEAHRMKAGFDSQRGAFLLNVSPFMARRDILTGTPMPQGPQDMVSQLGFLWPGQGMDIDIQRGATPRAVLGQLYVRTTKAELGLPDPRRHYLNVEMSPGQKALYGIVRSETLRKLTAAMRTGTDSVDFISAKRSVMRLLQLSVNPLLALKSITEDFAGVNSGIIDTVLEEGPSLKMRAVVDHARQLASENRKVVIWTIFVDTINDLERMLADLNPVVIYGAVPSGAADDLETREGRLRKFHEDSACKVLIANPATAGEGISLHTVCHDAIYLDRSYISTHYLQSIDRIHRLGLQAGVETNIHIYRTKAPIGLGSIDYSVSRRLAKKIRALQELLDDADLHNLALDEENADDPVDYSVDMQDLVDLVEELEGKHNSLSEEDL